MKTWAIALNTFREAIRDRVLYLLLFFALASLVFSRLLALLTVGDRIKIVTDVGLASISLFGALMAILMGTGLVYKENGKISKLPKMVGFQAEGAAPIVKGHIFKNPKTIATAIKIGNPASWEQAIQARDASGGNIDCVTDDEILEAYKVLANKEGVFVEPASAASVAGLLKYAKNDYFAKGSTVVCILTGHGLKDPDRAIASVKEPVVVENNLGAVIKEIGL